MSLNEIFQSPMPQYSNNINPFCLDDYSFSPFPTTNDSPDISSSMPYLETIFSDDQFMEFPVHIDELYTDTLIHDFQMDLYELDHHDHAMMASCEKSMHQSLILPFDGMEVGKDLCLDHLLRAYAEAMDNQESELIEVIAQRIIQKVSPLGLINDRLLYYMFQHQNKESDMYLEQESIKNFYPAFKAFYQMFPYGKFAHFVANFAILEALPKDVEIIHLFDFDIGEGVQWASFMEAFKHRDKDIRLTSIKFNEDDETSPFRWRFEDTKRRLCDHAKSYDLMIKIEEVGLQDLKNMILNIKREEDYRKKSWYVFNSHVALPHMGRTRSRRNVLEFLRLGKEFLHQVPCWGTSKGIVTYGSKDALHDNNTINSSLATYSSFLDGNLAYYRALLESMETNFPSHLEEARIALESLFVAPNVSGVARGWKWKERRQYDEFAEVEVELMEGLGLSEPNLVEAKEVVSGGVSLYRVRIEGERNNEMVMEWDGVPMVRVCCWKC